MKVNVYDLEGKAAGKIDLPRVFKEPLREDLILRAVLASQSKRRQPYGRYPLAGKRSSAHYHGARRVGRWRMMGREMARMPRIHGKIPGFLMYRARKVPQAVKGRLAHPPKVEKVWAQKINKKERQKAIRSAIAATADKKLVQSRGHKVKDVKELPIVVENDVERIKKTSEVKKVFEALGLKDELKRISRKKVRAGKAKGRGRKYKIKIGPLIVVGKDEGISKAVRRIPGTHVSRAKDLSAEELAPGATAGRLTIFTKSAIENLGE